MSARVCPRAKAALRPVGALDGLLQLRRGGHIRSTAFGDSLSLVTTMDRTAPELFTAPVFLATGFLLLGMAILEKALNLVGSGLPVINVYPRQLLDWALILVILEIAITLRQIAYRLDGGTVDGGIGDAESVDSRAN